MSRYAHLKRSNHTHTGLYLMPATSVRGTYSSHAAAYLNGKLAGHIGATDDGHFYSVGRNKPTVSLNSTTARADRTP